MEKTVKGYTRKGKNGKTIVVKSHTRKCDGAACGKGAGKEYSFFERLRRGRALKALRKDRAIIEQKDKEQRAKDARYDMFDKDRKESAQKRQYARSARIEKALDNSRKIRKGIRFGGAYYG